MSGIYLSDFKVAYKEKTYNMLDIKEISFPNIKWGGHKEVNLFEIIVADDEGNVEAFVDEKWAFKFIRGES